MLKHPLRQEIVGRRWMSKRSDGTSVYSWQPPSGRRTLATLRMALSIFGEVGNVGTNVLVQKFGPKPTPAEELAQHLVRGLKEQDVEG